jgi:hypothetical protein
MGNHYHLLIETPHCGLSSFMHTVTGGYTTYFNIKRNRSGHLYQGRYKSILIEKDSYLLQLSRYIHLNPVRAGIVQKPEDYAYTSYRDYITPEKKTIVFRDLIWNMISRNDSPQRYKEFVESALTEETGKPFPRVYGGMILGGKQFIKEALQHAKDLQNKDISHRRTISSTMSRIDEIVEILSQYFAVSQEAIISSTFYKNYAVYLSRKYTPLSNTEIGRYFGGISYSAVTKIGTRLKHRIEEDDSLRQEMDRIEAEMSRVKG